MCWTQIVPGFMDEMAHWNTESLKDVRSLKYRTPFPPYAIGATLRRWVLWNSGILRTEFSGSGKTLSVFITTCHYPSCRAAAGKGLSLRGLCLDLWPSRASSSPLETDIQHCLREQPVPRALDSPQYQNTPNQPSHCISGSPSKGRGQEGAGKVQSGDIS